MELITFFFCFPSALYFGSFMKDLGNRLSSVYASRCSKQFILVLLFLNILHVTLASSFGFFFRLFSARTNA